MSKITIYCDGASRGNPGKAACGFVVLENDKVFYKEGKLLGVTTNNFAEYSAVVAALEWLLGKNYNTEEIEFVLDSQLVVNQLKGIYKIKNKDLLKLSQEVKTLERKISPRVIYKNVLREKNKIADSLVNQVLDEDKMSASKVVFSEN